MKVLLEKSSDVFKLVLAAGILICILLVTSEIIRAYGHNAAELSLMVTRLTPVLLLTGVLITAFLVVRIENAFAISISVLIIGTVVAGDRFLLSITALLTSNSGEGGTLVRDIYADVPGNVFNGTANLEERQALAEEIVRAITATQDKDQGEEAAVQVVENFIGRAQVAQLAGEVASRAAQQPLLRLYESNEAFALFAASNFGNPLLQEQMVYLRGIGLVEFLSSDLTDAELTRTGFEVAAALARPFEIVESSFGLEVVNAPDALAAADRDSFEVFGISDTNVAQPITWDAGDGLFITLDVDEADFYVIEITDAAEGSLDTVIELLTEEGEILATDDDGGTDLLSKLVRRLDAGRYYLRVVGYLGEPGTAALTIQR